MESGVRGVEDGAGGRTFLRRTTRGMATPPLAGLSPQSQEGPVRKAATPILPFWPKRVARKDQKDQKCRNQTRRAAGVADSCVPAEPPSTLMPMGGDGPKTAAEGTSGRKESPLRATPGSGSGGRGSTGGEGGPRNVRHARHGGQCQTWGERFAYGRPDGGHRYQYRLRGGHANRPVVFVGRPKPIVWPPLSEFTTQPLDTVRIQGLPVQSTWQPSIRAQPTVPSAPQQ